MHKLGEEVLSDPLGTRDVEDKMGGHNDGFALENLSLF